jgi:uroporphyrinogen-III synthase
MAICSGSECDAIEQLGGFTIGITADRRSDEQAELLRRRGADVLHGPTIHTLTWSDEDAVREATERVIAEPPDVVVANTGIGIRSWVAYAESRGLEAKLLDVLSHARIVARGPKAAGAVSQLGLAVDHQSRTERLDDLLDDLVRGNLEGGLVALQLSGSDAPWAAATLNRAGARVIEVPVYRWTFPDDLVPAHRLLDACIGGGLAAVTFTSPPALDHLFTIAADEGKADQLRGALNDGVLCACVGPVTGDAALAHGIASPLWPERGRLGLMIRHLSEALHRHHRHLEVGGHEVVLQGAAVLADGVRVTLTERERAVLGVLARRPGAVVPKPLLLREIWGVHGDPHVVDITVGRLRRRLEPTGLQIQVSPRRGYRLDVGKFAS